MAPVHSDVNSVFASYLLQITIIIRIIEFRQSVQFTLNVFGELFWSIVSWVCRIRILRLFQGRLSL